MDKHLRADNDVLDRLKEAVEITSDRRLAEAIGITPHTLVKIRKGEFPGKAFQTWVYMTFGNVPDLYCLTDDEDQS